MHPWYALDTRTSTYLIPGIFSTRRKSFLPRGFIEENKTKQKQPKPLFSHLQNSRLNNFKQVGQQFLPVSHDLAISQVSIKFCSFESTTKERIFNRLMEEFKIGVFLADFHLKGIECREARLSENFTFCLHSLSIFMFLFFKVASFVLLASILVLNSNQYCNCMCHNYN